MSRTQLAWPGVDARRPVLVGELPYYRASPDRWRPTLAAMKEAGIDVVSFYVPWRFHERSVCGPAAERFDFVGRDDPQADVVGFLRTIGETGLAALVKPGPFIHAEVQLGGLPDRLCDPEVVASHSGRGGARLMSQGKPLPRVHDPVFRREVDGWMAAVNEALIRPFADPRGPIVGVQLGNEGVIGEACRPVALADLGTARPADAAARAVAAADAIVRQWALLAERIDPGPARVVNAPLVRIGAGGEPGALGSWLARTAAFRAAPVHLGHTEWVGDASCDADAFVAHALQITAAGSDVAEANWGFTWTTSRFADGRTPLFHGLLALALGARTLSIYTAAATRSWNAAIDMDADGLRADGLDPALYGPPYCPGAPFEENGGRNPNHSALLALRRLVDAHGAELAASDAAPDLVVAVDAAVAARAAEAGEAAEALDRFVAQLGAWLFADGRQVVLSLDPGGNDVEAIWRGDADTEVIAARLSALPRPHVRGRAGRVASFVRHGASASFAAIFNPFGEADEAEVVLGGAARLLRLPPHAGLIVRARDDALEILATTHPDTAFVPREAFT
ncbi:beta-galactosidase [Salinarimonas chemoclinalis]|uniref:beta-galactosidase n=1 Tax=Salinarimonas chemoclinalis TaxID=3241599 RepID=UPI003558405F